MVSMTKPHGNKGRKQSPEHVAARVASRRANGAYASEKQLAAMRTPEYRAKQAARTRGRWASGAYPEGLFTGHAHSAETRQHMSEIRKQMWADGRYENKRPATRRAVSAMERSLAPYLAVFGFRHTEERECFISCDDKVRMPDYVNVETRQVFEFFGNFWHHPDDELRWVEEYSKKGWECIILWEDELHDWLIEHAHLVEPAVHMDAMKTARTRTRYKARGNPQMTHSSPL